MKPAKLTEEKASDLRLWERWCVASALFIGVSLLLYRFFCGYIGYYLPSNATFLEANANEPLRANLVSSMRFLAAKSGPRNLYGTNALTLDCVATWIETQLRQAGCVLSRQVFAVDSNSYSFGTEFRTQACNIVAEKIGTGESKEVILIGAHYDTMAYSSQWQGTDTNKFDPKRLGTPGANDNASGVAALLEIARYLAPLPTKCNVRYVAFANEEPPFFEKPDGMGSWRYVTACKAAHDPIRIAISLDALAVYDSRNKYSYKRLGIAGTGAALWGLPDRSDYVAFMSNREAASGLRAKEWAAAFSKHSSMAVRTACLPFISGECFAWSDDWSFTRHGYPAFTITDTAFYRSERYHERSDTFENLTAADFDGFATVVLGLCQTVAEQANLIP